MSCTFVKASYVWAPEGRFQPARLQIAREFQGVRARELDRKLGLRAGVIAQIETGKVLPWPSLVQRAGLVLHFPAAFFYEPPSPSDLEGARIVICDNEAKR